MLTRSVKALLLAAPLALVSTGCASSAFKPHANGHSETLSSSHTDRLLQLAQRYEKQGNYEGAQRLYRQAERAAPGNPLVQSSLAAIAARQKPPADPMSIGQVADSRAPARAGQLQPATVQPGRSRDRGVADPAAANPSEPANSESVGVTLPAVQPAREADWPIASTESSAGQRQDVVGQPSGDPEWWRATQAVATTDNVLSPGQWTQTSWSASQDVADSDLNNVMELLRSNRAADRKEGLADLARLGPSAGAAVPVVQSLTRDADPLVQAHAAWALWAITRDGIESVPVLTALLASPQADVVQVSAYLLGSIGPDAAGSVAELNVVLQQADAATRLHAAEALSRITPDSAAAVQLLISALKSSDAESRWLAAIALSGVAPPHRDAAVAALIGALRDTDANVCAVAALTLGGFGPDALSAVPQLEQAMAHPFEDVRVAAQTALACITR